MDRERERERVDFHYSDQLRKGKKKYLITIFKIRLNRNQNLNEKKNSKNLAKKKKVIS